MIDARLRVVLRGPLARLGSALAATGVRADVITVAGWVVGAAACVAAGFALWPLALVLWLLNRALDGLDGPIARAGPDADGGTDLGGFLDVVADFTVYGGFVAGVAVAVPDARLACVVLLATYYASATAMLTLSSMAERRGRELGDERSVRFLGGIAEGFETVVVYVLFCLLPAHASLIAWVFAAAVAVTAVQRVLWGVQVLREPIGELR